MGFTPCKFPSARRIVVADAAVTISPSGPGWVSFKFRGPVAKRLGIKKGDKLTPLIDKQAKQVLLIVNSDQPSGFERNILKTGSTLYATFPRKDEFSDLFQGSGTSPMKIVEHGLHRIVFKGDTKIGEGGSK